MTVTTSKRLIQNSILNVVTSIINAVIGFFIIPFYIFHLGAEAYGVWVLIGSIYKYRNILSLGLNSAVNRYVPISLANKDNNQLVKIVSTSTIYYLLISSLLLFATLVLQHYINDWFNIPFDLQSVSSELVIIVGIGFTIMIPLNQFSAILSGYQRYDILNLGTLLQIISRTIILILLLKKGYSLIAMGLVFAGSEISVGIFNLFVSKKLMNNRLNIVFSKFDYKLLSDMIRYGVNTFLYIISTLIIYRIGYVLIGIYLTPDDITQFSVLISIILVLSQLLQTFLSAIKPAVSDLDARNDNIRLNSIAILSQKYSLIFLIPASLFFILMGKEFLTVWLGNDYSHLNTILTILIVGNFFFLAQYSNFKVLVGLGKHRIFGILALVMALLTIIFSIISLSLLKLGLLGMAISSLIPMFLISGIALQLYYNKCMSISFIENIRTVWVPSILGSTPGVIILMLWQLLYTPINWLQISFVVASTIIFTIIGSWFFSFSEKEQNRFLNFLRFRR